MFWWNLKIKQTASVSATENTRFVAPLSETGVKNLIDSQENVNTKKNTTWALRVFVSWRAHRNSYGESVKELHDMNTEEMNYYLGRFIAEARKQDGKPYPPRSLYLVSCGLLRHLRGKKVYDKNLSLCQNIGVLGIPKNTRRKDEGAAANGIRHKGQAGAGSST